MTPRTEGVPLAGRDPIRFHAQYMTRAISLGLCAVVIGVLAFVPAAVVREDALLAQAIMPVIVAGLGAGLAHGMGYVPRNGVVARLISPLVSWPLMLSALAFLVLGTD